MKRELLTAAEWRARHLPGQPSRIVGDPEVRAFIDARLSTMTFVELAEAARVEFGLPRAPSKSAIARYWHRLAALDRS